MLVASFLLGNSKPGHCDNYVTCQGGDAPFNIKTFSALHKLLATAANGIRTYYSLIRIERSYYATSIVQAYKCYPPCVKLSFISEFHFPSFTATNEIHT